MQEPMEAFACAPGMPLDGGLPYLATVNSTTMNHTTPAAPRGA